MGPVLRGGVDGDGNIHHEDQEPFPPSMEPQLRKLGVPCLLKNGVVMLLSEYTVCQEGQVLTFEQAAVLKLFWIQMALFKVKLDAYWTNGTLHQL